MESRSFVKPFTQQSSNNNRTREWCAIEEKNKQQVYSINEFILEGLLLGFL